MVYDNRPDNRGLIRGTVGFVAGILLTVNAAYPEPEVSVPKDVRQLVEIVKENATYTYADDKQKKYELSFIDENVKGYTLNEVEYTDVGKNGPDNADSLRIYSVRIPHIKTYNVDGLKIALESDLQKHESIISLNEAIAAPCFSDNNLDGYAEGCTILESKQPVKFGKYSGFDKEYHQAINKVLRTLQSGEYTRIHKNI